MLLNSRKDDKEANEFEDFADDDTIPSTHAPCQRANWYHVGGVWAGHQNQIASKSH